MKVKSKIAYPAYSPELRPHNSALGRLSVQIKKYPNRADNVFQIARFFTIINNKKQNINNDLN